MKVDKELIKKEQDRIDLLIEERDLAQGNLNYHISTLDYKGMYYDKNNKVIPLVKKLCYFTSSNYYRYFNGETSDAVYEDHHYAKMLTERETKLVIDLLKDWDILTINQRHDVLSSLDIELPPLGDFYYSHLEEEVLSSEETMDKDDINEDIIDHYQVIIKPLSIQIVYVNETDEQGTFDSESFIGFKMANQKNIDEFLSLENIPISFE